jgi:hypothetical protein
MDRGVSDHPAGGNIGDGQGAASIELVQHDTPALESTTNICEYV